MLLICTARRISADRQALNEGPQMPVETDFALRRGDGVDNELAATQQFRQSLCVFGIDAMNRDAVHVFGAAFLTAIAQYQRRRDLPVP